jgi:DNA polymerase
MREEYSYGIVVISSFDGDYKYLLLKRAEGWLDFPKGHIEEGETGIAAALRETREESGIAINEKNLIPYFHYDITYRFTYNSIKILKHVRMFMSIVPDNTIVKVSHEHRGYVWLNYSEAMENLNFGNQKELMQYANSYLKKYLAMDSLNSEYKNIPLKGKWNLSVNFVPGEGNLNSRIFFIGQAPGKNEDIQRRPFIGRSGKLLDSLIEGIGLHREEVYITSVVQFFPPGNRPPTDDEVGACMPFLKKQIEIVNPQIIVLLGGTAAGALLNLKGITAYHGKIIENKYLITVHPAAALRNPANLEVMKSDFKVLDEFLKSHGSY